MESARAAVALHQQLKTAVPCPAEVQQDSEAPSTAFKTMLAWTITAMNRWWASSLLYVRRRLSRLLLLFCCFLFLFWFVVYSVGWTDRTGRFCRWCHFGGALLLLLFFFFCIFVRSASTLLRSSKLYNILYIYTMKLLSVSWNLRRSSLVARVPLLIHFHVFSLLSGGRRRTENYKCSIAT